MRIINKEALINAVKKHSEPTKIAKAYLSEIGYHTNSYNRRDFNIALTNLTKPLGFYNIPGTLYTIKRNTERREYNTLVGITIDNGTLINIKEIQNYILDNPEEEVTIKAVPTKNLTVKVYYTIEEREV